MRPVAKTSKVQPRVQGTEARRQLAEFLSRFTTEVERVAQQALKKMRARMPGAVQLVYDNYNALVFGFSPTGRASDALLSVIGYPRWVSVGFLQGASVADPDGLLRGTGNQVRGLRLGAPTDLDDPKVQALITRALSASRAEFAAAPPLRTVVKSVSAKQRSRR